MNTDSINFGKFLYLPERILVSEEGLWFIEVVS
jgi:hypothetical protein